MCTIDPSKILKISQIKSYYIMYVLNNPDIDLEDPEAILEDPDPPDCAR